MNYINELKRLLVENKFLIVMNGNYSPFSLLQYSIKYVEMISECNFLVIPSHIQAVIYDDKFDCEREITQEFYGNSLIPYMIDYANKFNFKNIMYMDDDVFLNDVHILYDIVKEFIDGGYGICGAKNLKFFERQSREGMSDHMLYLVNKYSINMYFMMINLDQWNENSNKINEYAECDRDKLRMTFPELTEEELERFETDWLDEPYSRILMGAVHELKEMEIQCVDVYDSHNSFFASGVTINDSSDVAMYHLWYSRIYSENFQFIYNNDILVERVKVETERMKRVLKHSYNTFIKFIGDE